MLAAIVPHGGVAWSFKLQGSREDLEKEAAVFEKLLQSVRFAGPNKDEIQWDLPPGWKQNPGSGLRYATLIFGSQKPPLEVSVSMVRIIGGDEDRTVLDNVNRWRKQMSLSEIDKSQLKSQSQEIQLADATATLVNLTGTFLPNMRPQRPFPNRPPTVPTRPRSRPAEMTFDVPAGWKPARGTSFSKHAFVVEEGGRRVDITVTLAGGPLLGNLKRWRGQVQLPPVTDEQIQKEIKQLKVGNLDGSYVEFVGPKTSNPRKTILGVIAPDGAQSWFIKLTSDDPELAQIEKPRFEAFIKSIKFTPPGSENGN